MGTLTSMPGGGDVSSCASTSSIHPQTPCVLRVLVADENQSSLLARTVPLRPSMTVRDVTKLLALKLRLSNPQDFTLVALVDGQGALQNHFLSVIWLLHQTVTVRDGRLSLPSV
jgi:hypothetical protein